MGTRSRCTLRRGRPLKSFRQAAPELWQREDPRKLRPLQDPSVIGSLNLDCTIFRYPGNAPFYQHVSFKIKIHEKWFVPCRSGSRRVNMASEQESSNGPVKKSMREKAIERRGINKEHNSNFKAGYVPIEEERLHKTGLRGRKGNMAVCIVVLLFLLALINLIITLVIWTVIRIGPNGCDSMEFHESGLLRFKQKADMGIVHPLHKSTVGGRKDQDLVLVGNNNPVVFQQGTTKLSVEKDKTSVVSDVGISFTDPRTQNTFFSTDFENHEFHLPKGVKVLSVKKASTERITSSAASDLTIKSDSKAIIRGNEGVNIMGRTVEFKMGGGIELRAENSIVLNGSVMFNASRIPNSAGDVYFDEGMERYKLCMCADGTLFRVQVKYPNMGCQTSDNPCGKAH